MILNMISGGGEEIPSWTLVIDATSKGHTPPGGTSTFDNYFIIRDATGTVYFDTWKTLTTLDPWGSQVDVAPNGLAVGSTYTFQVKGQVFFSLKGKPSSNVVTYAGFSKQNCSFINAETGNQITGNNVYTYSNYSFIDLMIDADEGQVVTAKIYSDMLD